MGSLSGAALQYMSSMPICLIPVGLADVVQDAGILALGCADSVKVEAVTAGQRQHPVVEETRAIRRPGDAAGVGVLDLIGGTGRR